MKAELSAIFLLSVLTATGCLPWGRGGPGSPDNQTGTAREEGSTPYAVGRAHPFQRAGMADANIAATREEAALDVSGSGTGELARRSAAATVDPQDSEPKTTRGASLAPARDSRSDEALSERIRTALSTATPEGTQALSIQTLNNVQVSVKDGVALLEGRVTSENERRAIESLVRRVDGVKNVENHLELFPPQSDPLRPVR